METDLTMILR